MATLLEQIAAMIATLNDVKALCQGIVSASMQQQADYTDAGAAQAKAGVSSVAVVDLASKSSIRLAGSPKRSSKWLKYMPRAMSRY